MKQKLLTLLLISTSLFVGCKNNTKEDIKEDIKVSKITITLNAIVPEDDVFQVYYTEDGTANCTDEKSVKTVVKGSNTSQKIVFEFPEELAIAYLRMDFGENRNQRKIIVNDFVYDYYGKKFQAKGNKFFHFFTPNENMLLDLNTATLSPIVKNNNYDPILYGNPNLGTELKNSLK